MCTDPKQSHYNKWHYKCVWCIFPWHSNTDLCGCTTAATGAHTRTTATYDCWQKYTTSTVSRERKGSVLQSVVVQHDQWSRWRPEKQGTINISKLHIFFLHLFLPLETEEMFSLKPYTQYPVFPNMVWITRIVCAWPKFPLFHMGECHMVCVLDCFPTFQHSCWFTALLENPSASSLNCQPHIAIVTTQFPLP